MMTTANIISFLRILLTPVFVYVFLTQQYPWPLILFILITLTDALDGFVARISNQCSFSGAFLDTVADKFLLLSTLFIFVWKNVVPQWFFVIVLSRDIFIVSGWFIVYLLTKDLSVKPRILGKMAIILEMTTVFAVLFKLPVNLIGILCYITAVCTICSALDYSYVSAKKVFRMKIDGVN